MAKNITARDLMKASFLRLGAGHSLREAMGILLDPQARREDPRVLIVLNPDGSLAGLLTTRYLLQGLLPDWVQEEGIDDEALFERRLLSGMQERLDSSVSDAMARDLPLISPDDRLPRLIEHMHEKRLDCLPVLEAGRVLGIIYLTDIFNAAANLALTSQTDAKA